MTRNLVRTAVVTLALTMGAFAQTAPTAAAPTSAPAPTGPAKIGIINIQGAVANTNEGKRDPNHSVSDDLHASSQPIE